ncbi:MAG: UDP-N-acetylmuramoyl-tripeptide--D-alanyl-D-alanine ligase [Lachnospiraceae bacterium]|nr:UDP-N-acetylmuramoyl-tripeptide--D-alanyl-D-alanine ligase [Lachnospiraceae bacterium]
MIIYIITAMIFLIAISISLKFYMHMFQLNSYAGVTQFNWYFKNSGKLLSPIIVFFVGEMIYLLWSRVEVFCCKPYSEYIMLIPAVFALLCSLLHIEKNVKKKLVFTMRVIRMYVTDYILILAVLAVAVWLKRYESLSVMVALYALVPAVVILGNVINKPIEKGVNNHYINEAKKILKGHNDLKIIGITGSFGKTSVKYYLNTLLKAKYNVLMTPESYNTPMGVVKTIRGSLKPVHEIFICEMGAKKVGEIKEICDIVYPHHGIITSIGPQHLETFKSLDNVKKTKFELADALPEGGLLLVNGNDENIKAYNYGKKMITYGVTEDCDYYAYDIDVNNKGTSFTVKAGDEVCQFKTDLIGRHNVINIVGTIAMAHLMGISLKELKPQVRKLEGVPHRLQLINKNGITIIDDAFNSNPTGSKAALDTLALFDGTKILITPGMVELGAKEEELNKEFGRQAAKVCDYIFLVGINRTKPIYEGIKEEGFEEDKVIAFNSLTEALDKMYSLMETDKVVLLENDLPDNY